MKHTQDLLQAPVMSSNNLPPQLKDILVGSLLGDGSIRKSSLNSNAYFTIGQCMKNSEYILHLYELFKDYCSASPYKCARFDKR
jgi:hypothetical protein